MAQFTLRRSVAASVLLAGTVAVAQPVPPVQPTPGENQLTPAKRDADRSTNDAGKAAHDGANKAADQAKRAMADAEAAKRATAGAARPAASQPTTTAAAPDAAVVRRAMAEVVRSATTPDDLKRLARRFAEADGRRLGETPTFDQGYGSALDGKIRLLTQKWSAKYGHDLAVVDVAGVFGDEFATVGTDPSNGLVTATVAATPALPAVTLRLARDADGGYRPTLPAGLTAELLRRNLDREIGRFAEDGKAWPENEVAAYRILAHRVLLAVGTTGDPAGGR